MPSIFLSHSSLDKPFVRRLAERLTQSGALVWLDEAQLQIGDSLVNKISEAIHTVDYVVAIISKNSCGSRWVKKELSLAVSKEIKKDAVVVLPAVLDDCEIPAPLADKLYVDFREPNDFDNAADRLLRAMNLGVARKNYQSGIAIEWTDEGPRMFGSGVSISSTEGNALLDRWNEYWPRFIQTESKRGRRREDTRSAAHLLAVLRACSDTYGRVPSEEEMVAGKSELARKFNLLFLFFEAIKEDGVITSRPQQAPSLGERSRKDPPAPKERPSVGRKPLRNRKK